MKNTFLYQDLTEKIIGCFYEVHNELSGGFLESVYEKSLIISLEKKGLLCEPQKPINVFFQRQLVGQFKPDLIVENKIIIEIKAVKSLTNEHKAQLSII